MRRRIIIAGGVGSGRPGVGDAIRRLAIECLVRSSQFGSSASSMNVLCPPGMIRLKRRYLGTSNWYGRSDAWLFDLVCKFGSLFLDGIFNLPENQQRRLLAHLEPMGAGLYRHLPETAQLHLISGIDSEFGDLRNDRSSIHRVLFEVLCRDGLIRLLQRLKIVSIAPRLGVASLNLCSIKSRPSTAVFRILICIVMGVRLNKRHTMTFRQT